MPGFRPPMRPRLTPGSVPNRSLPANQPLTRKEPPVTAFDRIVEAIQASGKNVRSRGDGQASAQCPAHEDRNPSLSLTRIEGQALVHCHGGCQTEDVLTALGLNTRDLFDDLRGTRYHYTNRVGTVQRTVSRTPDKTFKQSGDTKGPPTLYRLPEVLEAVENAETIYLVEGEKDVHALESLHLVATTAPMGASNIDKADLRPLYDADVVAVVDRDDAGQKWAAKVLEKLEGKARSLSFVEAKVGKDAADHIAANLGVVDLVPLDAPEHDVPLRRARITWASEIEPEPVVWAWMTNDEGRIPAGSLCIAAGREGTGKSSFGMWKAAQITKGTLPGSYYGTPRKVFYVAVEDSWKHTIVPRLLAAGANLSMVGRFEVVTVDDEEITLSLPHDNQLLERQVAHHNVALVVIDPLMSVIGERIDTHREREVRSALDPLAKMADRTGSVFLGIAHFNKGTGTDAASLITGSGAFKNVPRSVFAFARDDSDENGGRVMSQVKNSLGRDDLPSLAYVIESAEIQTKKGVAVTGKFSFTGESEKSVADVLRESRGSADPEEANERDEAASWLLDCLASRGGSAPFKDILKAARDEGISERTLKRARSRAGVTYERTGFPSATYWQIPQSGHSEASQANLQSLGLTGPTVAQLDEGDLVLPARRACAECGEPIEAGKVRHGACFYNAMVRDRIEKAS